MPDLDYVTLVGRFGIVVGDGIDVDDEPDVIWCDEGEIRLVPLNGEVKIASGSPVPWTGGVAVVDASIDTNGYLSWRGKQFVQLVDLTSDKVNPTIPANKATHRVEFRNVKADSVAVSFTSATVRIAADTVDLLTGTCDLTKLLPVQTGNPTPIYSGPRGTGVTDLVQPTPTTMALELTDGTTTDPITLPVGPGGSDAGVAGYLADPASASAVAVAANQLTGLTTAGERRDAVDARADLRAAATVQPVATLAARRAAEDRRRNTVLRGTPVTNESQWYDGSFSGTTIGAANTRKRHQVIVASTNVRFVYANIRSRDDIGNQDITVRAALELANGTIIPLYFSGKRDIVIGPGGIVFSDPCSAVLAAGDLIYSKTYVVVPAGGKFPQQGTPQAITIGPYGESCDAANGTTPADKTTTTGALSGGVASSQHYSPVSITAEPLDGVPRNVLGLIGDSIGSGLGDNTGSTSPAITGRGFVRRAFNNVAPHVSIAASGEAASEARALRTPLIFGVTHGVCELGTNDMVGGSSLATFQADIIKVWRIASQFGAKWFQTTIFPKSSSTDNWATTANQTPHSSNPVRITANAWIRDGAPLNGTTFAPVAVGNAAGTTVRAGQVGHPLAGWFETTDLVESARDSGIWRVGTVYLTDALGIHPSPQGHIDASAGISVTTILAS